MWNTGVGGADTSTTRIATGSADSDRVDARLHATPTDASNAFTFLLPPGLMGLWREGHIGADGGTPRGIERYALSPRFDCSTLPAGRRSVSTTLVDKEHATAGAVPRLTCMGTPPGKSEPYTWAPPPGAARFAPTRSSPRIAQAYSAGST